MSKFTEYDSPLIDDSIVLIYDSITDAVSSFVNNSFLFSSFSS